MKIIHFGAKCFAIILFFAFGLVLIIKQPKVNSQPVYKQAVSTIAGSPKDNPAILVKVRDSLKIDNTKKLLQHKQEDEARETENISLKKQLAQVQSQFLETKNQLQDSVAAARALRKRVANVARLYNASVESVRFRADSVKKALLYSVSVIAPTLFQAGPPDTVRMWQHRVLVEERNWPKKDIYKTVWLPYPPKDN